MFKSVLPSYYFLKQFFFSTSDLVKLSMNLYIALLIAATATSASAAYCSSPGSPPDVEESHFAYQLKSFREELDECAEYLQVSSDAVDAFVTKNFATHEANLKCLVRCVGINAGWWGVGGNNTGLQGPVLESYFQPGCDDVNSEKRTKDCLDCKSNNYQDDCSLAYESFMCYYHQYGYLKSSEEYVPLRELDAVQAAVDCMLILRTSKNLLEQYSQGVFPAVPETQCLYRCQYLAEGLYDGVTFNLTRFYVRNFYKKAPQLKSPETQACVDSLLNDNTCNECARVYKARTCTNKYADPYHSSKLFQAAAVYVLSQQTCNDENKHPRYNPGGSQGGPYEPAKPCGKPCN